MFFLRSQMGHAMNHRLARGRRIDAEKRFPVRLRLLVPKQGYGAAHGEMHDWLRERVGDDGFAEAASYSVTMPVDTSYWYFPTIELAAAFKARWGEFVVEG